MRLRRPCGGAVDPHKTEREKTMNDTEESMKAKRAMERCTLMFGKEAARDLLSHSDTFVRKVLRAFFSWFIEGLTTPDVDLTPEERAFYERLVKENRCDDDPEWNLFIRSEEQARASNEAWNALVAAFRKNDSSKK